MFSEAANEKLKRAFIEAQSRQLSMIDKEMEENSFQHEFSEHFNKRMARLLKISTRPYFRFISTTGKRAAVIIVAIFMASVITTFSVEALREPVVNFIVSVYEKFTSIVFDTDEPEVSFPETIEEIRVPINMPDDYIRSDTINAGIFVQIFYSVPGQDDIIFEQYVITNMEIQADTEGVSAEQIDINGKIAIYYMNKETSVLTWTDGEYGYTLTGKLEKDVMISMTELQKQE